MRVFLFTFLFLMFVVPANSQLIPFSFWRAHLLYTWMGGPSESSHAPDFGTQGVSAATNIPGVRNLSLTWVDTSGKFWLFGGSGFAVEGGHDLLNDFWKYDPATSQWTWVSGPSWADERGYYGSKGVGSTNNYPGARAAAAIVQDASANVWIFGGSAYDSNSSWGFINDLWKYNPSNGQWTWVSGKKVVNANGVYGTKGTGSTSNYPGGRSDHAAWSDGAGNLWFFGGMAYDTNTNWGGMNDLWKYNISTQQWTWVAGSATNSAPGVYGTMGTGTASTTPGARWDTCSWMDSSGNLWIFGGWGADANGTFGQLNDLWQFNITTLQWIWRGGSNTVGATATFGTKGTGSTSNIPGARQAAVSFKDGSGNFWLLGGTGLTTTATSGLLNDLWKYNPTNGQWTWVSGSNLIDQTGVFGTLGVASAGNSPPGTETQNVWVDGSGNFWFFGGYGKHSAGTVSTYGSFNSIWKYSVSTGYWTWMSGYSKNEQLGTIAAAAGTASAANLPSARNYASSWADSSGNLYLFGGYGGGVLDTFMWDGALGDFWKYSLATGQWTWLGGSPNLFSDGYANTTYGTKGMGSSGNLPGGRYQSAMWTDSSGIFWLFGGVGWDANKNIGELNDLWKYNPSNGQWTWVSGAKFRTQSGAYGTKGTGSTSNIPGGRDSAITWVDTAGNLWIFGGWAYDSTGNAEFINDLWKYNPSNGEWTWVSGSNVRRSSGTFGTKGTPSTANAPSARAAGSSWTDTSGNLWLFGGLGYDSAGNGGVMNDIWKFNPSTLEWTWIGGSNMAGAWGVYGTMGIGSTSNSPGARMWQGSWSDGAGNFWLIGGNAIDSIGGANFMNDLWKYNYSNGQWTWVAGGSIGQASGIYNTLGVTSRSSSIGGRTAASVWHIRGTTWIFGGLGADIYGRSGYINDFWKFSH